MIPTWALWQPDAARALRMRHDLGRDDLKLLFNVNAEFASPVGSRSIEARAESAVFSSLADAVLVSGPMTGQPVDASELSRVKDAVGETPVLANTGCTAANITGILSVADGCVVGTHFKVAGDTWNPVDRDRVAPIHGGRCQEPFLMSFLLGLDIGTTSTIGILVDCRGGVVAIASRPQ